MENSEELDFDLRAPIEFLQSVIAEHGAEESPWELIRSAADCCASSRKPEAVDIHAALVKLGFHAENLVKSGDASWIQKSIEARRYSRQLCRTFAQEFVSEIQEPMENTRWSIKNDMQWNMLIDNVPYDFKKLVSMMADTTVHSSFQRGFNFLNTMRDPDFETWVHHGCETSATSIRGGYRDSCAEIFFTRFADDEDALDMLYDLQVHRGAIIEHMETVLAAFELEGEDNDSSPAP